MHFLHAINSDRQTGLLNVFGQIAMFWGEKKNSVFKMIHVHVFCVDSTGGSEHSSLVAYGPVLSGRIIPDVSSIVMPPSPASNLTLKKDESTRIRRNARNHSPPRFGRLGQLPLDNRDSLKGVPLPCRTCALVCFLSCEEGGGVAKQEGLLASLA